MIVADTSSILSLTSIDLLETLLTEFDVHVTELVIEELEETSEYDDRHGDAARTALDNRDRITVHEIPGSFVPLESMTGKEAAHCLRKRSTPSSYSPMTSARCPNWRLSRTPR